MAECSGSVVSNNVITQKQSSVVQSTGSAEENKTEKVMEPILLEDFRYNEEPRSLSNLLEFFEKSNLPANKTDLLVGLVYILMLESGFVPIEQRYSCEECSFNYQRLLMFSRQLPKNWKRDSLYTFSFVLPPFQVYECSLAFVLAADDLLVNCVVKGVESGHFNTILDPLFYFTSSTTQVSTHKLQNLNQLSRAVKNSVCYPAKQVILKNNGLVVGCFDQLPPEIVLLIMSYLNIQDLVRFGRINSYFFELMKTPKLWIKRILIDFKKECSDMHTYDQLRNFYKKNFRLKQFNTRLNTVWW